MAPPLPWTEDAVAGDDDDADDDTLSDLSSASLLSPTHEWLRTPVGPAVPVVPAPPPHDLQPLCLQRRRVSAPAPTTTTAETTGEQFARGATIGSSCLEFRCGTSKFTPQQSRMRKGGQCGEGITALIR